MTDTPPWLETLKHEMPIALGSFDPAGGATGLAIIDEVNGFCTVGAGNLAPVRTDEPIDRMVRETDRIARMFKARRWPILAFLDTHEADRPEPPYPPHCVRGTGEEELVAELRWLESDPDAVLIRKNCINGFVGAIEPAAVRGSHGATCNRVVDWVNGHRLDALLTVGICTDICVMDFVLTMLSARNHGLMPTLKDIVVYEPACATYDLPRAVAASMSLPETAAHPRAASHHLGLYFMMARGALLAERLDGLET